MTDLGRMLRIDNGLELLKAHQEGRPPVPEIVIDALPARFEARVLGRPAELRDEGEAYDGREL